MLYVVTGHPRSGTSMMMAALRAGGMEVAFDPEREAKLEDRAMAQKTGFNPSGVWELHTHQLAAANFPAEYDGQLVKLVWGWLNYMKPYDRGYRVISMTRHPEEVHQSFEATLGGARLQIRHNYAQRLEQVHKRLEEHDDVMSYHVIDYAVVLDDPWYVFETLHEQGWPIDFDRAADIPHPKYHRFRVGETITEGA